MAQFKSKSIINSVNHQGIMQFNQIKKWKITLHIVMSFYHILYIHIHVSNNH